MHWASPLLAKAVSLGLIEPHRLGRLARRARRRNNELPACDSLWADELFRAGAITHYQVHALLADAGDSKPSCTTDPIQIGPYLVLKRVGRSDLGATYCCRQPGSRELVAIKVIDERWRSDDLAGAIDAEMEAWQQLDSAIVRPSRRVELERDKIVILSPWVVGRSIQELLYAGRRPTPAGAMQIWRTIVLGLASADSPGRMHGNLRPSNILVSDRGRVQLTDAGIRSVICGAALAEARDLAPEYYDYVAPEVAAGEPPDSSSEIYSLGCLLYHLVTGRVPHWGGTARHKSAAHRLGSYVDPVRMGVELPGETRSLLSATLQPDRMRRVGSFNELLSLMSPARPMRLHRAHRLFPGSCARLDESPRRMEWKNWWAKATAFVAASVLVIWAGVEASTYVAPWLQLPTPVTSPAIVPDRAPAPAVKKQEQSAVTAVWDATEDLKRAYRESPPGGTITLRSPGPFLLDAIELTKPVTIRGAAEIRPLFLGGPGSGLRITASGVVFENVHFARVNGSLAWQARHDAPAIVSVFGDRTRFVNCSFQDLSGSAEPVTAIDWQASAGSESPQLELRNVLFKQLGAGVVVSASSSCHLMADNCLHLGPGPLVRSTCASSDLIGAVELSLSGVSVVRASAVEHSFPHPLDRVLPLRVVATKSMFVPRDRDQPMLLVRYASQPNLLMPNVTWSGSVTLCPADATLLEVSRGPTAAPWRAADVAAWNAYWGSHATGIIGVPLDLDEPDALPVVSQKGLPRAGADMDRLLYPAPITLEQLPMLIDRLRSR